MFKQMAHSDFDRARRRAFWRKIQAWLTGKDNALLPYEEVRRRLPFQGQRYIGEQTVPIENIIGSEGRYRDFDRAFLPTQDETNERWISIGSAHYADVLLPPVELYKIGDVYFVKDGNHRVSVARERGQLYIDAHVTEVKVPIRLTVDTDLAELDQKQEYIQFMSEIGLVDQRPEADLEMTVPGGYDRLREHIRGHQYYLGEASDRPVSRDDAVLSWYDNVYLPLVGNLQEKGLDDAFDDRTLADLYLYVSEYQWLRREAYQSQVDVTQAADKLIALYNEPAVRGVVDTLRQAYWIDELILARERESFLTQSQLHQVLPEVDLVVTLPGKYDALLHHISVHRWYLGEQRGTDVAYSEALLSWYNNVYLSIVNIIREHDLLEQFPQRTETDLYLWIMDHRPALPDLLAQS